MEFIEAPLFTRLVYDYMDDAEYSAFQIGLASMPDSGDLIPETAEFVRYAGAVKEKVNVVD